MRKLSTRTGTFFGTMFMMIFICKAWTYCPIEFLYSGSETKPDWVSFILCIIIALVFDIAFNAKTKKEGTYINGKRINLNDVRFTGKDDGKGNVVIKVPMDDYKEMED